MDELQVVYNNKQVQFAIEPSKEVIIKADPVYFDCCVRNLLDNAVKYSDDSPIVNVRIDKDNKNVHLFFEDYGQGITVKNKKRVFHEFYRANEEPSVKNHGIGLAFVKQIVRAHSGKILVESTSGKGCKFTIILPQ